jgi:hypothetical protein
VLKKLRYFLEAADTPGDWVFTADDLDYWARGARDQLVELGILKEIAAGQSVICHDCGEEECVVEPDIRPDPDTGRMVGMYHCPADHGVGTAFFELDRFRQWQIDCEGLAVRIAEALGLPMPTSLVVPHRIWMLGTKIISGAPMDLFWGCGLNGEDGAEIVDRADRLKASLSPVVIVPANPPPAKYWQDVRPKVFSLLETIRWQEDSGTINYGPLAQMLDAVRPAVPENRWLTVSECAELLLNDVSGIDIDKAKARVSKAASSGKFGTNGKTGSARRIDKDSFSAWRLEQRERDLEAEEWDE